MKIISGNKNHIEVIQKIAIESWKITYSEILSKEQFDYMIDMMYSEIALQKQMTEQNQHFLLIEDDKSSLYCGFISYELNYKNQLKTKIHKLYLLPRFKGKGLGRLLIDKVASIALASDNSSLSLNMNRNNKSFGFYNKMGFEIVGEEDINIGNNYLMEDYILEKKITTNNICALFDMDGVIIDTEPQYDIFWKQTGEKYNVEIENFEKIIKGTTLPNILKKYFSHLTQNELNDLNNSLDEFEQNMNFTEIAGSIAFVQELKAKGIKVGLVTSSTDTKLVAVNKALHLDKLFDTIVSANRVTEGKPNPRCFILAAQDLDANPKDCIVFEDSFAGIQAGESAGMKVIGLSTTNSADLLKDKCYKVIPDFRQLTLVDLS